VIWNSGNDDPLEADGIMKRYGFEVSENKIEEIDDLFLVS
jgi:Icc-related predicted phosphoesterase